MKEVVIMLTTVDTVTDVLHDLLVQGNGPMRT